MDESDYYYYDYILESDNETNSTNGISCLGDVNSLDPYSQSVIIICIIAGTIGNLLVCFAILLDRKLQNLANYFLLSLAVTDLLISLLIWPGRLIAIPWVLEPSRFPWYCLYLVGNNLFTYASAIHICFISFERYLAIRNPFNRRTLNKRRVAVNIGLVWFIAFLAVIPLITLAIIKIHPGNPMTCKEVLSSFDFFLKLVLIDAIVIGIMLVVVVLSLILTTILLHKLIKKQKNNMARGNSGLVRTVGGIATDDILKNKKLSQGLHSEQKALRIIWLVTFAFIFCWAPNTYIYVFFASHFEIPEVSIYLAYYLNCFYPVLNPILYTIFNKTFRDNFKDLILFKFKKR